VVDAEHTVTESVQLVRQTDRQTETDRERECVCVSLVNCIDDVVGRHTFCYAGINVMNFP